MNLLSTKNTKLGKRIASWSISRDSCVGRTEYCAKYCYGKRGSFCYSKVKQGIEDRLVISKSKTFTYDMIREIRSHKYDTVRVHVVGDFYSPKYVADWHTIALYNPGTTFYAYTRAWRINRMRLVLEELRKLPNFILLASTDMYTGNAPIGWLEANMSEGNMRGYHECVSKCEHCNWCYTGHNVYFRTRKPGRVKRNAD